MHEDEILERSERSVALMRFFFYKHEDEILERSERMANVVGQLN